MIVYLLFPESRIAKSMPQFIWSVKLNIQNPNTSILQIKKNGEEGQLSALHRGGGESGEDKMD